MNVSIIIPTYQADKFLARSIRSAMDQNYPKDLYEIIVVDDGSTDNTSIILDAFKDDIRVVKHDINKGLSAARNAGLRQARGRYVVNLDADDYMHKDTLRVGALFLDLNPTIDAVAFDYIVIDEKESHTERKSAERNPIACGIFFRTEQLIDIGLYDESFFAWEEEDLRIRFQKKYNIHYVNLPLYRYRRHSSNLTDDTQIMDEFYKKLNDKHKKNNEN